MDIGAMICQPKQPRCHECPVQSECTAQPKVTHNAIRFKIADSSAATKHCGFYGRKNPTAQFTCTNAPAKGYGRICGLPVFDSEQVLRDAMPTTWLPLLRPLPAFTHVLTHKDLLLYPFQVFPEYPSDTEIIHVENGRWVAAETWEALGLPAPVRKLLQINVTATLPFHA